MRRFLRDSQGNVVVEFAMCLPIFLVFVVGLVEFGRLYMIQNGLNYAVGEAARFALVYRNATNDAILERVESSLPVAAEEVTVTVSDQAIGGVNYKTITAEHDFSFSADFLGFAPLSLEASTRIPDL